MPKLKPFLPLPEKTELPKIYTPAENEAFDKEMRAKFFVKKTFTQTKPKTAMVFDTVAYLKSTGAMTDSGVQANLYEREMDRIDQWIRWSSRKQFAQKKRLESYAALDDAKEDLSGVLSITE